MKIKEIMDNFKVTQNNQQGVELTGADGTKMIIPQEKMAAFQADPTNPNKFSMNPQAMQAQTNPNEPAGPKVGAEVTLPPELSQNNNTMGSNNPNQTQQPSTTPEQTMGETQDEYEQEQNDLIGSGKDGDIGGLGDKTDDLISDVEDKKFTRASRGSVPESRTNSNVKKLAEDDELSRWLTIARLK
jgi:hypothetical protein